MNIICLGDSLMQFNKADTYPQTGWVQELNRFLKDEKNVAILDFAKNGTSTKSFISLGYYQQALKAAAKGDVIFISFGHNDEKAYDKERYTKPYEEYQENLKRFYSDFTSKGCFVVFFTSVSRLQFNKDGKSLKRSHGEYPQAMKDICLKLHAPCIDLEQLTRDDYEKKGFLSSTKYLMYFEKGRYANYPEGKEDTTHLREEGAMNICSLVVPELKKIDEIKGLFN
jgi:lysophospholipase L1-like esterase